MVWFFILIGFFVGFIYLASISTDLQNRAKREREEKLKRESNCTEEEWKQRMEKQNEERQKMLRDRFDKRQALEKQNIAYCPKCLSTSITLINSKQNGVKRAIVGGVLAGGAGSIVGAVTAKNKTSRVCLKCNHRW